MAIDRTDKEKRTFLRTLKSAELGHPRAQYAVGLMYANGAGVVQDSKEAIHWYGKAAEHGDAWHPINRTPDQMREGTAALLRLCERFRRATPPAITSCLACVRLCACRAILSMASSVTACSEAARSLSR